MQGKFMKTKQNLSKLFMDLANEIKCDEMQNFHYIRQILRRASHKIGDLELKVIDLQERVDSLETRIEIQENPPLEVYPLSIHASERPRIKVELDRLGVEYSTKENTQRLLKRLQKALRRHSCSYAGY